MTVVPVLIIILLLIALCVLTYGYLNVINPPVVIVKTPDLEIGGTYVMQGNDPFNTTTVKILDIKNNWVQYRYIYNGVPGTTPVTSQVERFSNIYERIKDAVDN